jgi:ribonuclease VapC
MGSVIFVDTSVFVAILAKEPDWSDLATAIGAAEARFASPVVRLETCIVLATRLLLTPLEVETQFEKFLEEAGIVEAPIDPSTGAAAVACFERDGKGRHPARLNFADCLSYACAKEHDATLLFKGDDFGKTDVNEGL